MDLIADDGWHKIYQDFSVLGVACLKQLKNCAAALLLHMFSANFAMNLAMNFPLKSFFRLRRV
ncbi:MAG: hypothetical protein COW16_02110 [Sphingomonadales bacterium CG12_big_fil_rev_8_21_14_0_65_65_10]|nr:MAG: hypothetical protein COW16_02110 [Sphingomonadales bacterium CG12_big_fil_rev_8_21_14_0_65_65_10]